MSANKILAVFGQDDSNMENNRIDHYDWAADSVNCVYMILMTGRCGSTWLTRLLADSGMCGEPDELFNETVMPRFNRTVNASNFRDYFKGLVKNFSPGGRFGFKIDEYRFQQLLPLINFSAVFPKSITRFFWMTRSDIVSQGYSFARANATGHWHDFKTHSVGKADHSVELSDIHIWNEILSIIAKEKRMEAFFAAEGIEPINLSYEQMTADRILTVMNTMNELECQPEEIHEYVQRLEDKTLKLEFGQKYKTLSQFNAKYKILLRNLGENRVEKDLGDIRRKLQLDYNLPI